MTRIMRGQHYALDSYGNGFAYELIDTLAEQSVFVQGDDASQLWNDIEGIEAVHPDWSPDALLAYAWDECNYGSVAEAVQ